MCCAANEYHESEINGECEKCGERTVDGDAFDTCSFSPVECDECGWAPCDGSC